MPLDGLVPELSSLDLLVTVGETGSIGAAAALHGLSQPAASMRLRVLEQTLGLHLLERSPTGSRLTPAGAATVEWAARVLEDVRALMAGASALRNDEHSRLRLAASLTVADYLVPGWLARLAAVAPEVGVSLQMGNSAHVVALVRSGAVDLGFVEGRSAPAGLRCRELCLDDLLVVVPPDHPWARRRRPLSPQELAATPLILREEGSGTREVLVEALGALGLAVNVLLELGSTTAIKAAVAVRGAPSVLSALALASELQAGALVEVPCPGLVLERTIRAVWSGRHPLGRTAARLLSLVAPQPAAKGRGRPRTRG